MKTVLKILLIPAALFAIHCGGGGGAGRLIVPDDFINPSANPASDADLANLAENTFLENGVEITTDPAFLEFEPTEQDEKKEKTFVLTNSTSNTQTLTISFSGISGGFRLLEESGQYSAYKPNFSVEAGQSITFTVEFDASLMGISTGYLEITASGVQGYIHMPFRGTVTGSADYKVIASSQMCSNRRAPELDEMDFRKAAYGTTKTSSFKICNTGGEPLQINSIRFLATTGTFRSEALSPNPFTEFEWTVNETLNTAFFNYYNLPVAEPFVEPEEIPYTGALPNAPSAFSVTENSTGNAPNNLVIAAGSYARFTVAFSPNLNVEAPLEQRFAPVSFSADMQIDTSQGQVVVDVAGASSGREPILKATYTTKDSTTPVEIDLDSSSAVINFGTAEIFTDWITEDPQDVVLTFENIGNGSEPLKVWMDPMTSGYFTFIQRNPERTFPVELAPGLKRSVRLRYAPTPPRTDGLASIGNAYDLGQAFIRHNGGNGPRHKVLLMGEEDGSQAVQIDQGSARLRTSYEPLRPKNFCVFKIGEGTPINFTVRNNSGLSENTLTTSWSVSSLSTGTFTSPATGSIATPIGSQNDFSIRFTPATTVTDGSEITGNLTITNTYALQGSYGVSPPSYNIPFRALASATGVCGGGNGNPLNGQATFIVDRITMIMPSLIEAARNSPAFKFHLPIDLDTTNRTARIHGLAYNVSADVSPVEQIRSFAHQFTNVSQVPGCFALPTNPYQLEFEEGSWDGPFQCDYNSGGFNVIGSSACMANNGAETFNDTAGTYGGGTYQVFYHEFVKFDSESCGTPAFFGKIATFSRRLTPTEESIRDVFARMEANPSAPETFYEGIVHAYGFDSFITFNSDYTCRNSSGTSTNYTTGTTLRAPADSEAIKVCWNTFAQDNSMKRVDGMVDECSYFQFTIEEGCVPGTAGCGGVMSNKDTWHGFGEYEPTEGDETKWDLTLRNVHIQTFVLTHGGQYGPILSNKSHLLYSDLYVTLTTKAVGEDISNANWQDLVAVESRNDFPRDKVFVRRQAGSANTERFWTNDGVNSEFTTGPDDNRPCFDSGGQPTVFNGSCKGNYRLTSDGSAVMHAGEPVDFVNRNRTLLAGLASFHGKGETAPSFAQESAAGIGPSLYFTFHGCFTTESDVGPNAGCYDEHIDERRNRNGTSILNDYVSHGILEPSDLTDDGNTSNGVSKAMINYVIFDEDRNRLTDYFAAPNNYFFDGMNYYRDGRQCGYGM